MTEKEWLACTALPPMLEFLQDMGGERKLQLFGLACCRRITVLFPDAVPQAILLTAERLADGSASREGLIAVARRLANAKAELVGGAVECPPWWPIITAAFGSTERVAWLADHATHRVHFLANDRKAVIRAAAGDEMRAARESWEKAEAAAKQERIAQCHLLRDLLPYHAKKCDFNLLTSEVASLARAAYEERALPSGEFDAARLAVLADALEEEGCDNTDILTHLRSPGPHVRGCWAVDLLLGKS
jgi:hypothetical protein